MKYRVPLIAGTIIGIMSQQALATNGYAPHGIGQISKGMGGVGVALPQDTLAGGTNPAGMVHMGNRMDLGMELFRPIRETTISGTPFDATYDGNGKKHFLIPEFGYNRMINNNLSFGVSVFGTGGMNTTYKSGIPLFGNSTAGVDLAQLFIVPSLSWKLNDAHSIGIGINLAAQKFKAFGLQNFANAPPSFNPTKVTNNGNDYAFGIGARLGWMGKVSDTVTLGATYQTRTRMSEFDDYAGLFAEQGDFDIPENFALGIALQATPKLTLAFDVMRINYSGVASISNPLMPNLMTGGIGSDGGAGFGWEDQTIYKIGASYAYSNKLTLRAGFNHADSPIPNNQTEFNILAPATTEDHLTLGASWKLDNGMNITASYMHAFENEIKGSGSMPNVAPGAEADIKMYQDSIGVAVSWDL